MKLVRVMSDEFIETLNISADLFKKYQMTIHRETEEESDNKSFFNFLVKSPLQVHFVFFAVPISLVHCNAYFLNNPKNNTFS